jgi:hypothetical protein
MKVVSIDPGINFCFASNRSPLPTTVVPLCREREGTRLLSSGILARSRLRYTNRFALICYGRLKNETTLTLMFLPNV